MNWIIITLVVLALIGSVTWVMPTPRQRLQAELRKQAMQRGLQVQLTRLLFPRGIGESTPEERPCIAYRLARTPEYRNGKTPTRPWHIFKIHSHATRGLPDGWCWSKGEDELDEQQLALITDLIRFLPGDTFSIESTPIAASIYWAESGDSSSVQLIQEQLKRVLTAGL
jgi:hypothetical protein